MLLVHRLGSAYYLLKTGLLAWLMLPQTKVHPEDHRRCHICRTSTLHFEGNQLNLPLSVCVTWCEVYIRQLCGDASACPYAMRLLFRSNPVGIRGVRALRTVA